MPFQHTEGIGHGHVIERYAARKDSGHARYLVLKSGRFLRPEWPHSERFARDLIEDAATITDAELEALLGYEWRSRLTAGWLIGVGRRADFRDRLGSASHRHEPYPLAAQLGHVVDVNGADPKTDRPH
ncbi:DUF6000 family protein [Streptomyces cellulosae]